MRVAVAVAVVLSLISTYTANPAEAAIKKQTNIPAQGLGPALQALARDRGLQVVFVEEEVASLKTAGAVGELTADEALTKLLVGTGLRYKYLDDRTITVLPLSAGDEHAASEAPNVATAEIEGSAPPFWQRVHLAQNNPAGAAQDAVNNPVSAANAAEEASEQSEESTAPVEVIVTGSRISRTSFDMPTPVQTIDPATIQQSGLNNIGDILNRVPSMGVGLGTANAQANPDGGSIFVDLRSMGIERTLTLVNGRRRVSGSSLSSAVDLSTIPAAMIESVDIITGGASAVYGADAVTGVVNIKLREDFDGLELSGRTGMSQYGDANSSTLSVTGGTRFSENRGSIALGVTYTKDEPLTFRDRDFSRFNRGYYPNAANTGPNDGIPDLSIIRDWRIITTHPAGTFFVGDTRYTVDPNLRPTQNGRVIDYYWAEGGGDGYDGGLWDQLRVGNDTVSGLVNLKYRISDAVGFFSDVQFANTKTNSPGQPTFNYDLTIQRDNPYIPADLASAMDANGLTSLAMIRGHNDHGAVTDDLSRYTYTIVSGFNGDFDNGMKWETFFQYGEYRNERRQRHTRIMSRFFESVDAISDPVTGAPVCRSGAARANGCQPLNVLGRDTATEEALAYFQHTRLSAVNNTQKIAGLSLTGDAFDLPAGSLSYAVGAEYREEGLSARDDGLAVSGQLDPVFSSGFKPVDADFSVKEVYAEVRAPILVDKPVFKALNFEAAIRFSDYSTIGRTTAWKLGTEWGPAEDFRFRATRSRSVRAPNLNELLSPGSFTFGGAIDPCDAPNINGGPNRVENCRALGIPDGWVDPHGAFTRLARLGGNPDLNEETSDSWTVGLVLTPTFVPGLNVSIDYWKITIDGAINPLPQQTIVDRCVDSDSIDNPFCPLITRDSEFSIDIIDSRDINIGQLAADGIDFQATYDLGANRFSLPGRFRLNLSGTYLMKNEELVDPSNPDSLLIEDGEFTQPHWRANMGISYLREALLLNWTLRYIGPSLVDVQVPRERYEDPEISARLYNDVFASYALGSSMNVSLGVNNLFNVEPPSNPMTYAGSGGLGPFSQAAFFDSIGRYFFLGAQMKF